MEIKPIVTKADHRARVFAAFGPRVPDQRQLGRRIRNPEIGARGMELFRKLDIVDQLARIDCPTLVCVGELDPVTPVDASREIFGALPRGAGRLEVIEGAGHFPWKDVPERYWAVIEEFVGEPRGMKPQKHRPT